MPKIMGLTGNEAGAEAMRQINPDVVAAYPITPQTELMHKFSDYVADGKVDTEMVLVESEHSAMSATVGAAAAGSRAMTATSSQGLALMFEVLNIASGLRLPIVMPMINRALSAPINIHCDHSDSMGVRDAGWIHLFAESAQEVYDLIIMGIRLAEHHKVLLPVMVCFDGFIISHTMDRVEVLDDDVVQLFVGEYKPVTKLLDVENPITIGALYLQDHYFEHKIQEAKAFLEAKKVFPEIAREYESISGRKYDFFETYKMEDADVAILSLGSTAGTTKDVVDQLRAEGKKVGAIKVTVFRPFNVDKLIEAVGDVKALAVLDRSIAFGSKGGPVYTEIQSALYAKKQVPMINYIYGLGGRDIFPENIKEVYENLFEILKAEKVSQEVYFLGVRENNNLTTIPMTTE